MREFSHLGSRVARRLFLLFLLCSIVPIGLAGALTFVELEQLLARLLNEKLRGHAREYGMALVGRLDSAEELFRTLSSQLSVTDLTNSADLLSENTIVSIELENQASRTLPALSESQQASLMRGATALVFGDPELGGTVGWLVAQKNTRGRGSEPVYAQLSQTALWGNRDALPADVSVIVVGALGQFYYSSQPLSTSARLTIERALRTRAASAGRTDLTWQDGATQMRAQTWEVFLQSRFAAPAVFVIASTPTSSAFAQLGRTRILFPLLLLLVTIMAAWFAVRQIRSRMQPLAQLIGGTRRLAQRDFSAAVTVSDDDEFGELAISFNAMVAQLREQFATVESMAETDRALLRSQGLEPVLEILLPRVAAVVGSQTASVLLVDTDARDRARVYDFVAGAGTARSVRRIHLSSNLLVAANNLEATTDVNSIAAPELLTDLLRTGATRFDVLPLVHGANRVGALCLGFATDVRDPQRALRGGDFADRLSVVIANIANEERLYRQAHFDLLTALPNRQRFRSSLQEELDRSTKQGTRGAVLYVDLDHFKRVNDTEGHSCGDQLLAQVAQRFQSQLRDGETAARLGGDEFAVMISSLEAPYHAQDVADRLIAVLNESVRIDGRDHYISASIGITLYPNDGSTVDDLIKNADIAMYRAKELGRGRAVFYETELNVRMQRRTQIENALREAFRLRRCELHYQPVIDCASGACIAVEALIRWDLAAGANLWNTGELMAAADESGLIVQIGDWVVDRALRSFSDWRGAEIGLQYMSVNVSPRQLREPEFVAQIARLLRLHRVAPQELQIEITETVLSEGVEATRALTALAELGVKIALDDFGTGYSSLAYLRQYPINVIKIDQSFVRDLTRSDDARKLVETMLAMGRGLGKAVIAEGVETAEQYAFLIARGCDAVQGYWLARPMREVDLLQFRVPVMLTERKLQLG